MCRVVKLWWLGIDDESAHCPEAYAGAHTASCNGALSLHYRESLVLADMTHHRLFPLPTDSKDFSRCAFALCPRLLSLYQSRRSLFCTFARPASEHASAGHLEARAVSFTLGHPLRVVGRGTHRFLWCNSNRWNLSHPYAVLLPVTCMSCFTPTSC